MVWLRMASSSVLLQLYSLLSVEKKSVKGVAKGVAPPLHEEKAATILMLSTI